MRHMRMMLTHEQELLIFAHARLLRKQIKDVTVKDVIETTCECLRINGECDFVVANAYAARVIAAAGIGYDTRANRRNKKT